MNYYALTDIGKVRNKNQDQATVIANVKDQVIAIVCDGERKSTRLNSSH